MNEFENPFEASEKTGGSSADPFAAASPAIDLGSEEKPVNPFDMPAQAEAETPQTQTLPVAEVAAVPTVEAPAQSALFPEAASLPVEPATKQPQAILQLPIFAKLPVFEHGAVKEEIEDTTQTFEDLRVAKMDDFPELEDAHRVSWDVVYGSIRKTVTSSEAKKKKVGEFKSVIETSKEFTDALKKAKDKSPVCIVKPRITAQSKGDKMPAYKGVFPSLEEAVASDKVIRIVPGSDGKVYEIRSEEMGEFITPTDRCNELSEVRAGFIPALPLIPRAQLVQVITFFRSLLYTDAGGSYEAIANIYWDREKQVFCTCIPRQVVSAVKADSDLSLPDMLDSSRFLHYMDIHSHNIMPARFSRRDDRDEKATRLYAVLGHLERYFPQISVRISNGGKHLCIDPHTVFEPLWEPYPEEWHNQLTLSDGPADETAAEPLPWGDWREGDTE